MFTLVQILSFFFLGMVSAIKMGLTQNKIKWSHNLVPFLHADGVTYDKC